MSNLIKSVYFNVDPSRVRKIDPDEKVEDYIPNIYQQVEEPEAAEFQPFNLDAIEHIEGDYGDGLSLIPAEGAEEEEQIRLSEEVEKEKERLLAEAREEAEQIVLQARGQAGEIKEEARMQGFVQGMEEAKAQLSEEYEGLRAQLQADYEGRFADLEEEKKNLEPAFADLVISLVRKLTGVICEDKKEVILYLIGCSIRNLGKTSAIVLRVSRSDIALVTSKKATLKMLAKNVPSFDIVEDESLSENQCIIETDNKIIDCSLDSELQNLEEQVKLLAYYTDDR